MQVLRLEPFEIVTSQKLAVIECNLAGYNTHDIANRAGNLVVSWERQR